jgi:hypothetical protein
MPLMTHDEMTSPLRSFNDRALRAHDRSCLASSKALSFELC